MYGYELFPANPRFKENACPDHKGGREFSDSVTVHGMISKPANYQREWKAVLANEYATQNAVRYLSENHNDGPFMRKLRQKMLQVMVVG